MRKVPSLCDLVSRKTAGLGYALVGLAACTGSVGPDFGVLSSNERDGGALAASEDGPGARDGGAASGAAVFAPSPGSLRRLTRSQFRNSVRDVFGYEVSAGDLDADSFTESFATIGATTVVTSERGVEQYNAAIERAVDAVFSDATKRSAFLGCTPSGRSDDSCVRGLIQRLGLRAWRRPLEDAELDRFVALAASVSTTLGGANEGARWATAALFMSPSFLYRPELGAPSGGKVARLSGYEIASRLAFLVWNGLPDATLMEQAESGLLDTTEGVREAATRMLDAPQGREAVAGFADEFMRLDRIATQAKDPALFPEYSPTLQAAMVRDIRDTWVSLAFDDEASYFDLFTTRKVVVNAELARVYGLEDEGLTNAKFEARTLPSADPRSGLLAKPGFLSEFSNQQSGSPTLRGKYIREALMCKAVPPPPPDVNTSVVDADADMPMTRRQRLELHTTSPACAGCHKFMDPLGFPLEHFDAIGRYRSEDNGLSINATGAFNDMPVTDAKTLGAAVSETESVGACLVRKYYAYAVGHGERNEDASALDALTTTFQESGFRLRALILAVVTHDAFTTVAAQP